MLYKMVEWENYSGWTCACVDNFVNNSAAWYLPARILRISPAAYVEYVIENFKPDKIFTDKNKCLVVFFWKNLADCRKFKNFINKKAREINFQI